MFRDETLAHRPELRLQCSILRVGVWHRLARDRVEVLAGDLQNAMTSSRERPSA